MPSESIASWTSAAPAFDVRTRKKTPAPWRRHAARNGSTESSPRYGLAVIASASGIPSSRLEVRGGVRARGRADVAALGVEDDEQADRARVLAHLLERAHPVRAERLEERRLRLDGDDVRTDRVHDPLAEARHGARRSRSTEHGLAAELHRQQVEARVEPDDELAPLALDRLGEPVGEGRESSTPQGYARPRGQRVSRGQDLRCVERDDAELGARAAQEARDERGARRRPRARTRARRAPPPRGRPRPRACPLRPRRPSAPRRGGRPRRRTPAGTRARAPARGRRRAWPEAARAPRSARRPPRAPPAGRAAARRPRSGGRGRAGAAARAGRAARRPDRRLRSRRARARRAARGSGSRSARSGPGSEPTTQRSPRCARYAYRSGRAPGRSQAAGAPG